MKISQIDIKNFKRFTNLKIRGLSAETKVVLVVGPNGSGKSSLFDAFLHWFRWKLLNSFYNDNYYAKQNGTISHDAIDIRFHDFTPGGPENMKGRFYFRTAYRNEPDFTVHTLSRQNNPSESLYFNYFMDNDVTVQSNYQRLISLTMQGIYNKDNDQRTVEDLREELIGKVRASLGNVFDDLNLSSIGDPLFNGSFYFDKGISKDFHYKNLSGGEKSAFDLILDLIIKSTYYPEAILCIDEPEIHMHTRLQAKLFEEIYRLVPDNSQLWINTHSLGMLNKAREIDKRLPGAVSFIDFTNIDFDSEIVLEPVTIDRTIWEKFIEMTLDDLSGLLAPKQVVFCEGDPKGRKYPNFDSQIYSKIFNRKYPDTSFISIGSCTELENQHNITVKVVSDVLSGSEIIKVVDRDNRNAEEIKELNAKNIKVLERHHIESYLLDDEILKKFAESLGKPEKAGEIIDLRNSKLTASVERGNSEDDIKSASGDIWVGIRQIMGLISFGNSKEAFFRDSICPLITEDTEVFKELDRQIFG